MTVSQDQARFLVVQHHPLETPAAYEDELRARGLDFDRIRVDAGDDLPDWRDYDGMIVMGGEQGAYEDEAYPWLVEEKAYIREAATAGAPLWGVCLGAQLLAASLGASVYPGPDGPEVGLLPLTVTPEAADDPVFGDAPAQFRSLIWHGDTYDLPEGAVRLAGSAAYEQQAFVYKRAYALQFHIETTPELAAGWASEPMYAQSLETAMGPGALPRLLEELSASYDETVPHARELFGRWLDRVVAVQPVA